ncbi:MAG: glycosyltransferase family 9 protein [Dysgonamonadaceae bacterium]|jgi:ADP-heptose:LPS heptosyltransferase|nr:glycosyltransferase family 9 protein [Dysgonamonadaceae bacterium]
MEKNNAAITLVIRLSSLGDVAILIPALYSVASRNPNERFLLVTKKPLQPLFFSKPENLEIFPVQTKGKHKGFWGLIRMIRELNHAVNRSKINTIKVADLHAVARSMVVAFFFRLKGAKITVINKNRKAKKALVRKQNKTLAPLQTSFDRYREVFKKLGYDTRLNFNGFYPKENKKNGTWIGIAPFAGHLGKIYPVEQMEAVVRILNDRPETKIFLFGGKEENAVLDEWTKKYEHVESVAGRLPFPDELSLMNRLDVMLSMDSANMHLASLVNTPVVSVWGATHPSAGFYGYNQHPDNAAQMDLPCRPCSVFGNKPCWRGDYACLTGISPQAIAEKVNELTNKRFSG